MSKLFVALAMLVCLSVAAQSHEWYPLECCHALDCAPVSSSAMVAGATYEHGQRTEGVPSMVVTTRMGTAIVPPTFPRRESKDSQMHACMRPGEHGYMHLICIFLPPTN